ncbi:hypothetical protein Btru_075015 [Bulinus truncatus]|nr:hypothetical protein Btru_075015 [Bulinus truncatus]
MASYNQQPPTGAVPPYGYAAPINNPAYPPPIGFVVQPSHYNEGYDQETGNRPAGDSDTDTVIAVPKAADD